MTMDPTDPTVDIDSFEYADSALRMWLAAEMAITSGQTYEINGKHLTNADLKQVGERIDYWTRERRDRQGRRTSGLGVTIGIPRRGGSGGTWF